MPRQLHSFAQHGDSGAALALALGQRDHGLDGALRKNGVNTADST